MYNNNFIFFSTKNKTSLTNNRNLSHFAPTENYLYSTKILLKIQRNNKKHTSTYPFFSFTSYLCGRNPCNCPHEGIRGGTCRSIGNRKRCQTKKLCL